MIKNLLQIIYIFIVLCLFYSAVQSDVYQKKTEASADDAHQVEGEAIDFVYKDACCGNFWKIYNSGFRFTGIPIPQGSTIQSAIFSPFAYESANTGDGSFISHIYAEDIGDAPAFSAGNDVTGRTRTTAYVVWDNSSILTSYGRGNSPDIKTVIQEVINRGDWNSGNALVILWDDANSTEGVRIRVFTYDWSDHTYAPQLTITYSLGPGPTIYALTTAVSPSGAGSVALNPTGVPAGSYTAGASVQVTATANLGYTFSSWTGSVTGATNPAMVVVDADKTVTANFNTAVTYTLTTAVSPTIAGTVALNPTGGTYTAGASVQLTAIANTGYAFTSWSGGASGTTNPATIMVDSNKMVTANFNTAVTYTLTTTVSPAGSGTVALSPTGGTYTAGASVQLTATASSGYTFASWTGDAIGITSPVTITMNTNKSVTANFNAAATYTLTTTVSPAGSGTVALNPTGVPAGSYTAGTSVTVTATPATSYIFSSWSGSASGTTSPVTVTVDANKTVTATFTYSTVTTYALTTIITPTGGGTVSLNPGGGTYESGTTVTLTATAATNYTFSGWSGNATGTTSLVTVTMNANKIVTARFTYSSVTTYTLTTEVSPAGAGTVALSPTGVPAGIYTAGTTVTVTAAANSGYTFSGWLGDATGTDNPITVALNTNVNVIAYFTAETNPEETTEKPEVTAYPNPSVLTENCNLKFKETGITATEMKIYTLTGKLVRNIQKETSEISWDGKNEEGENVVCGMYIYVATGGDKKATGRIAVIR